MATHVYANGREIASKSADGSSKHALPDVCHTPPATGKPAPPLKPYPPGVPVPYSNTCHARDISNGSRTVFILGKEIALENRSYFSVSEGDNAATKKLAKGLISGAVKGRCYFQSWSPNVKVEGRGVARHLDLVSHNHKNPGNTGLFPYLSNPRDRRPCARTEDRINRACKPKNPPEESARSSSGSGRGGRRGGGGNAASRSNRPRTAAPARYNRDWRADHCSFLQAGAGGLDETNVKQMLEQAQQAREQVAEAASALEGVLTTHGRQLLAQGGSALVQQAAWSKVRGVLYTGGGALLGGGIGLLFGGVGAGPGAAVGGKIGAGASIAHAAYNAYEATLMVMDGKQLYDRLSDDLERMRRALGVSDPLSRYTNPDGSIDTQGANEFLADLQDALATADACTRARKCNLVPKDRQVDYTDTGRESEAANGRGCCLGQTGHHVLSDAMIKDAGCANYDYNRAPTVCVEGTSQNFGSHRRAHEALAKALEHKRDVGKVAPDGTLSLADGIDAAVESHTMAFLASGCDPQCTRAQLEAYYTQIRCPGAARVKMVDKYGKPTLPTGDIE